MSHQSAPPPRATEASAARGDAPTVLVPKTIRPVVVASANGHRFRNGGDATCVEKAFALIAGGEDALTAVIKGVKIVELDPADTSVGYGGLPNADGVVQLDACCMHGPTRRAGGVACLEGVRTPSLVARAVMEATDHHLLVGRDAQTFARTMGFAIEEDLSSDISRRIWLEWRRRAEPFLRLDPIARADAGYRIGLEMMAEGLIDQERFYGTINCNGVGPKGAIGGVTTTSGVAWRLPGRVGDSAILGAGLYVDGQVGAAGSTGRGEANLFNCSSFLIVEGMRLGLHPKDAGMEALRRIRAHTIEPRLLNSRGNPKFNVYFYILNARGEYAGVSMYPGRFAVCTENASETLATEPLLPGRPRE